MTHQTRSDFVEMYINDALTESLANIRTNDSSIIEFQISDRNLDVRKACLCVESLLEYLGGRQLAIQEMHETWTTNVTTIREARNGWIQLFTATQTVCVSLVDLKIQWKNIQQNRREIRETCQNRQIPNF